MKVVALCSLLLVAVTLVSSESGAITVFNNDTNHSELGLEYSGQLGTVRNFMQEPLVINPGETKTLAVPEGARKPYFKVLSTYPGSDKRAILTDCSTSKPVKLCFKVWDHQYRSQIGQIGCDTTAALVVGPGDDGAILVTNNATYSSGIKVKNLIGKRIRPKELTISPGETKTVAIPAEAMEIDFRLLHPTQKAVEIFNVHLFKPIKLCLGIWGTEDDPQAGQIDCSTSNS